MQPIEISEAGIQPHTGKAVCAVLVDGTQVFGVVDSFNNGQLVLKPHGFDNQAVSANPAAAAAQIQHKAKSRLAARTSGLAGYPGPGIYPPPYRPYPYAGVFALDLALIALLFAIPLLWL